MNVAVLVLGDVGRSPRMQFHAMSLQSKSWVQTVHVIGLEGVPCLADLRDSSKVRFDLLPSMDSATLSKRGGISLAAGKALKQSILLMNALFRCGDVDCVLVQNVPCIPTFAVLLLFKFFRGPRVVIDWHNLAFSLMQLSMGKNHVLVKCARFYEGVLGWLLGDSHLTVTNALRTWLIANFRLSPSRVSVQYDKAPALFKRRSVEEQHELFSRFTEFCDPNTGNSLFTGINKSGQAAFLKNRPFLLISSTSWTPDEDFSILLEALVPLDRIPSASNRKIICVITGKGPQREMYEERIRNLRLTNISIHTMWLADEDYRALLGSADLGISLHCSSSSLDLPMKVVDMFGSGLPVCAMSYPCIDELVHHDENGLVFSNARQLAGQLHRLFYEMDGRELRERLRKGAINFGTLRWEDHWEDRTAPVVRQWRKYPTIKALRPMVMILLVSSVTFAIACPKSFLRFFPFS